MGGSSIGLYEHTKRIYPRASSLHGVRSRDRTMLGIQNQGFLDTRLLQQVEAQEMYKRKCKVAYYC